MKLFVFLVSTTTNQKYNYKPRSQDSDPVLKIKQRPSGDASKLRTHNPISLHFGFMDWLRIESEINISGKVFLEKDESLIYPKRK